MKPMPHMMWLIVTATLCGRLGMTAVLSLMLAIGLNLVWPLVAFAIAGTGAKVMGIAALSEMQALDAHRKGAWCGHTFCGNRPA